MGNAQRYKILYIEDDLPSRLLVKKILPPERFEFFEAGTGLQGLDVAKKIHPDLILMDLNLPDISGASLTAKIKSIAELQDVVIIAITAMPGEGARELSLVAGCDGYITKPIDAMEFPQQLIQFLGGKKEELPEPKREYYHIEFQRQLVDTLTQKITQLEKSNKELLRQKQTLKQYSTKLEELIDIIQTLQVCHTPDHMSQKLLDAVCQMFRFDHCLLLEEDYESFRLRVRYAVGMPREKWEKLSFPFRAPLFRRLFGERQILYNLTLKNVEAPEIRSVLQDLGTQTFTIALLGLPGHTAEQIFSGQTAPELEQDESTKEPELQIENQIIAEHLKEYLHSELFYFGGYLFLDFTTPGKKLSAYEVRILDTLLRTASVIYQNLQLREQLKQLFIRAEQDAITDYLTNLFNHRYFKQQLQREFNRDRRHNIPFSLLMLDIDYFKQYNDTFGHQAGDMVLRKIGKILKENTRSSDVVARYGGEEFAIISPELSKKEGAILAEKLRRIVESTRFPGINHAGGKPITISIGVAAFPEDADNPTDLIRRADEALYAAKRTGRNRVVVYSPEIATAQNFQNHQ